MGLLASTLSTGFSRLFCKKSMSVILAGPFKAGKTTILHKLIWGENLTRTTPSIGPYTSTVEYKNISFAVLEFAGGDKLHQLLGIYVTQMCPDGIIFVIDSNDRDGFEDAQDEFQRMLEASADAREYILLIFANKQDLPNSMSSTEIRDKLGLDTLRKCKWYIQESCAIEGNGIYEGLEWLSNELLEAKSILHRVKSKIF